VALPILRGGGRVQGGYVKIQRATVEDAAEILALQKLAYRSEAEIYGVYDIPPLTQTLAQMEADLERQVVLVAVRETPPEPAAIVGSVRAYEREGTCYIGRLIVHPEVQNQGLGTHLLAEIEAAFPQVKRYELFTGHRSARNLHLYAKLGYNEFKREPVNDALAIVFLEKTLS
jgi:ribosomal protein S18 acetylase RimI-like enzyme